MSTLALLLGPSFGAVDNAAGVGIQGQGELVAARRNLMPVPQRVEFSGDPLVIRRGFSVSVSGPAAGVEARVERAVVRMLGRLARQTGVPIRGRIVADGPAVDLRIRYFQAVPEVQRAAEDESYELRVAAGGAALEAPTPYGLLRGLETFLQLVEVATPAFVAPDEAAAVREAGSVGDSADARGAVRAATISEIDPEPADFVVPGAVIVDAPRFPWRGLLLDPGRHFLSLDTIRRNLDAMAAVKLNVLHFHLSEDQGFRVESKVLPRLHELGSDGEYYTQDEIRGLIDYARDRGIRVVPEFDMPGHATSWLVGYPELASAPGPYEIIETWGIQDPAMDPTRETTYELLADFIDEMTGLFPDAYFHIGGDEVNGNQWNANAGIQQFIVDNDLVDNHGLQTYFNRRIQPLLAARGKTMMGWDEIFQPGLPPDAVVHSWRGPEGIAAAARAGYRTVLSNGYYIDLMQPAAQHYAVDPLGGPAADLSAQERALVLGGEATMWGEYAVDETIDSRIWPRTAAIAERLWSMAEVRDADDMYRRLEGTSRWLAHVGVTHRSNYEPMLARLSAGRATSPLRTLTDVLEPLKGYRRGRTRPYSRFTPLNRLVDAARPESRAARQFGNRVDAYLANREGAGEIRKGLGERLVTWSDNHQALVPVARASTMLPEAEALSAQLVTVAEVGIAALRDLDAGVATDDAEHSRRLRALEGAGTPHGALQLMVVDHVRRLVDAARVGRR